MMSVRVLILVENNSAPSDRRVWSIARALVDVGWEAVVVCPQGREHERALYEIRDGVEIHRFPPAASAGGIGGYAREYALALWRTWRLVKRLARERDFDVVHACNPPDFLLFAAWPARRAGARLVFDHHDLTPELFLTRFQGRHRWLYRVALALERACFAVADVVLATNESYRLIALTRGGKHPEQVFVVRNGPDLERMRVQPVDPALRRGRSRLISYLGTMGAQDGVDHALLALAELRATDGDWHAIFAGDGDAAGRLQLLSAELGLLDRVEFVGWLGDDEIARLLCSSDVCLEPAPRSPLNERSTMIKIAEYMAMSRPVVAYELPESRFTAGDAAIYAEPNDVSSFAARIGELLGDPERRERMGASGRRRVESELCWGRSTETLLAAYGSALNGAGKR